jgi:hypothetical protein
MSDNGAGAKIIALRCNPDETGQHFRDRHCSIEYNDEGIPIVARIRCKNKECCPKIDGLINLHLFTLWGKQNGVGVGRYVTQQLPFQDFGKLLPGARVVGSAVK